MRHKFLLFFKVGHDFEITTEFIPCTVKTCILLSLSLWLPLFFWIILIFCAYVGVLVCLFACLLRCLPAEACGAFKIVLAVRSEWFAAHDPPQRGHASHPPDRSDLARVGPLVGAGRAQRTRWHLVEHTQTGDGQTHPNSNTQIISSLKCGR